MTDLRQEIYERVLVGVRESLPGNPAHYVHKSARNHLIIFAKCARIVSFDLFADLETVDRDIDFSAAERELSAREELRRAQEVGAAVQGHLQ